MDRPDRGGVSVMHTLRSSVLNAVHPLDEQTNKAHRQIDGEPYFMLDF